MKQRTFQDLAQEPFDVFVIGGGILGAGIARDATLRGLRVALVEKDDFASGTSSRSTKLIHGGFRYLEQWEFGLVAEACRERGILQRVAPHLVHPQSFLLPIYERDPRPLWQLRLGMTLYDWFAGHQLTARHRSLTARESIAEEPLLDPAGLRGSVQFYDCQTDDARLCLEVVLDASQLGAVCVNYSEAQGIERVRDRIVRVWVRDRMTGKQVGVRAKVVVNAAGPWVERVAGLAGWDTRRVSLSPTKGIHVLLPQLTQRHGVFFQSRYDRRMLFLVPWCGWSLLGTTDTDFQGDAGQARADAEDVRYLLDRLHEVMPESHVGPGNILGSFAGIRPLLRAAENAPSDRSREYRLVRHGDNMLSVAGGKYTTFRSIADHTVRRIYRLLDRKAPPCPTATAPLPDRRSPPSGPQVAESSGVFESDIRDACQQELAVTLSDVMRRRTRLALGPHGGPSTAEHVSRLMSEFFQWNESTRQKFLREYLAEWHSSRAWAAELKASP